MREMILRAAAALTLASGLGAFAALLFTLKFAWSDESMRGGAMVAGALGLLCVCFLGMAKLAIFPMAKPSVRPDQHREP